MNIIERTCKNYISHVKFVTHNNGYFFVLSQVLELVTFHRRLHENGHLFGIDVRRVSRISGVKLAFCFWITRYLSHLGNILSNFEYNSFLSTPMLSRFQASFNTLTFHCVSFIIFRTNFFFQMATLLTNINNNFLYYSIFSFRYIRFTRNKLYFLWIVYARLSTSLSQV